MSHVNNEGQWRIQRGFSGVSWSPLWGKKYFIFMENYQKIKDMYSKTCVKRPLKIR